MGPARVLSVAGSDPGGGAGIQGDLKTISALGGYGMTVITALTVQDTRGVHEILALDPGFVARQIDVLVRDIGIDALKTGMLADGRIVETVAKKVGEHGLKNLVVDPVMTAKGGRALLGDDAVGCLIEKLLPLAAVVTPNIPEAEAMTGLIIASVEDMKKAAAVIHGLRASSVVIKGGHLPGQSEDVTDVFFDGRVCREFRAPRIATRDTHGTGCAFAAAVATFLARGFDLTVAVSAAKDYVAAAIAHAFRLGGGQGPVNHFAPFNFGMDHGRPEAGDK